jgi:hypothetical protein
MWGGATEKGKVTNGFVAVPTSEDCVSAVLVLLLSGSMKCKIGVGFQRQNVLTNFIENQWTGQKFVREDTHMRTY